METLITDTDTDTGTEPTGPVQPVESVEPREAFEDVTHHGGGAA